VKPEEFAENYLPLFQAVNAPDPASVYNARVNDDEPPRPPDGFRVPNVPNVWNTYADGYRAVADWIVESLPDSGISNDISVYPIAFCYRHYLELRLKALIVTGGVLFDQELATPNGHDMKALRDAVTPTLYKIWPNEQAHQDYQCLSLVIDQFSQFDHRSEAFRYPVDKQGARFLAGLECINIRRLKDALDVVAPTLDAISTEIEMYLDFKDRPG
jgi:hypothetical protein